PTAWSAWRDTRRRSVRGAPGHGGSVSVGSHEMHGSTLTGVPNSTAVPLATSHAWAWLSPATTGFHPLDPPAVLAAVAALPPIPKEPSRTPSPVYRTTSTRPGSPPPWMSVGQHCLAVPSRAPSLFPVCSLLTRVDTAPAAGSSPARWRC